MLEYLKITELDKNKIVLSDFDEDLQESTNLLDDLEAAIYESYGCNGSWCAFEFTTAWYITPAHNTNELTHGVYDGTGNTLYLIDTPPDIDDDGNYTYTGRVFGANIHDFISAVRANEPIECEYKFTLGMS